MFQRQHGCWQSCHFRLPCEREWLLHAAPPSTSRQAKHYCSACAALCGEGRIRDSLTWLPISFSLGPRAASSAAVSVPGSIPLYPACERQWSVHFVQSQEMAALLKVRVCETDTFFLSLFFPFLGNIFFHSLLPPHPTLSLGLFQEQRSCHSLPPKVQRASFTDPLAVQDTKKLN